MSTEVIYQKYIKAIRQVTGDGMWCGWGEVRLGLRLALAEMEEMTLAASDAACAQLRNELAHTLAERDYAEEKLAEVEEWKNKHLVVMTPAPSPSTPIFASMAFGAPAAGGILPAGESMPRIAPLPAPSPNGLAMNGSASPVFTNGSTGDRLDPTATPDWGCLQPAWAGMTEDEVSTLAALTDGTVRFGQVDKALRLNLIGRVMRRLADADGRLTMGAFNLKRPDWMPVASGVTDLAEGKWSTLIATALQAAAAPATA